MITLNQIKDEGTDMEDWKKIIKAVGGEKADFNNPFPLSLMLDLNSFGHAMWCFKCLPEYRNRYTKFALFCAKEVCMYADDSRVHDCINTTEEYLKGNADLKALRKAHDIAIDYAFSPVTKTIVANATKAAVDAANTILTDDYTSAAVRASDHAIHATAQTNAYLKKVCSFHEAYDAEEQKQIDYLRKLLDGEV